MLYISLIFAAILVVAAQWSAKPHPRNVRFEIYLFIGLIVLVTQCGIMFSLPVVIVGIGLLMGLILWSFQRQRLKRFWPISLFVVLLAYSLGFGIAASDALQRKRLREQYPFESLAERLPSPPVQKQKPLSSLSEQQLTQVETKMFGSGRGLHLQYELEALHDHAVDHFVNSQGFGVTRMSHYNFSSLAKPVSPPPPIEQTLVGFSPEPPPEGEMPFVGSLDDFRLMHVSATVDFVHAEGFGYVKDHDHVAGFQSHAFREKPEMKNFQVESVELIGLLLHPKPVVYVSNHLPAMEQLKSVPTRPLNKFEANGLETILKGEDLHVAHYGDRIRMVGAIRSVGECVKCHGGQRGDLLGAFVYTLREGEAKKRE